MIGYDTIHFYLEATHTNLGDIECVASKLEHEGLNRSTGEVWNSGHVGNLKVSVGGAGLVIKGSLAGFYYPNNTLPLSRGEVGRALESLSDTLQVDVKGASITRLDITSNFIMTHPARAYYDVLGPLTYFHRVRATGNTLYYCRGKENLQTLCFYDKERECTDSHKELPKVYKDSGNVLRYEARFNGRLGRQFNRPYVHASTLQSMDFFKEAVGKWGDLYFNINKLHNSLNMENIKTVSQAKDYICAIALQSLGADDVYKLLSEMKARRIFQDRNSYSRLKKSLENITHKFPSNGTNDLSRELDDEIRSVMAYA